ncbi:MAG: NAD(P)H-binding protein [Acidobacteriota bacterium]
MGDWREPSACLTVVTGAFGYSGKYIAGRLLAAGARVRTLTNSPQRRNPFGAAVEAHPYNFDRPDDMVRSLQGASVLINTYWVRFDHADFTHAAAVRNTLRLFDAAQRAGVRRIVHVSITNPSPHSALPYFRGKAELESALRESEVSYAILRPTVLFGREDILINNIAWMLRRFPVFGVFGDGRYKLQPIFVDDLAGLAVEEASSSENVVRDATGPETFTYRELVSLRTTARSTVALGCRLQGCGGQRLSVVADARGER